MDKFDLNTPMDAPIRMRERLEREEHERAMKAMRTPKFRKAIRKIVRQAFAKAKGAKRG